MSVPTPDSPQAIDHPEAQCVPCGPGCAGHWVVPDEFDQTAWLAAGRPMPVPNQLKAKPRDPVEWALRVSDIACAERREAGDRLPPLAVLADEVRRLRGVLAEGGAS